MHPDNIREHTEYNKELVILSPQANHHATSTKGTMGPEGGRLLTYSTTGLR